MNHVMLMMHCVPQDVKADGLGTCAMHHVIQDGVLIVQTHADIVTIVSRVTILMVLALENVMPVGQVSLALKSVLQAPGETIVQIVADLVTKVIPVTISTVLALENVKPVGQVIFVLNNALQGLGERIAYQHVEIVGTVQSVILPMDLAPMVVRKVGMELFAQNAWKGMTLLEM